MKDFHWNALMIPKFFLWKDIENPTLEESHAKRNYIYRYLIKLIRSSP